MLHTPCGGGFGGFCDGHILLGGHSSLKTIRSVFKRAVDCLYLSFIKQWTKLVVKLGFFSVKDLFGIYLTSSITSVKYPIWAVGGAS